MCNVQLEVFGPLWRRQPCSHAAAGTPSRSASASSPQGRERGGRKVRGEREREREREKERERERDLAYFILELVRGHDSPIGVHFPPWNCFRILARDARGSAVALGVLLIHCVIFE